MLGKPPSGAAVGGGEGGVAGEGTRGGGGSFNPGCTNK